MDGLGEHTVLPVVVPGMLDGRRTDGTRPPFEGRRQTHCQIPDWKCTLKSMRIRGRRATRATLTRDRAIAQGTVRGHGPNTISQEIGTSMATQNDIAVAARGDQSDLRSLEAISTACVVCQLETLADTQHRAGNLNCATIIHGRSTNLHGLGTNMNASEIESARQQSLQDLLAMLLRSITK